jgi:hypothetical protein
LKKNAWVVEDLKALRRLVEIDMGFIYDTHKKFLFMDWLAGTIFHRIITKAMWSEKQTLCSSGYPENSERLPPRIFISRTS